MGTPPGAVVRLVGRFDRDRKVFQSPDYKEEQLRAEFLNPFFESLGRDMNKALTWFIVEIGEVSLFPSVDHNAGGTVTIIKAAP